MTLLRPLGQADSRLDVYARLTDHQLRNKLEPQKGVLIAESPYVIDVALRSGLTPLSMLTDESRLEAAERLVGNLPADFPVFVLSAEEARDLTGYNVNRGPLMAFRRPIPPSPGAVLAGARRVAVLEGLVDVSNVGAVFRSAAALGVDAILVAPDCADPFTRRAVRVSMGTVFQVPWARCGGTWPQDALDLLHGQGFCCAALALREDAIPLDDPLLAGEDKLALFFGTEGTGLRQKTIAGCDRTVIIPMAHGVDSLNVAASSAVVFWELCRRGRR